MEVKKIFNRTLISDKGFGAILLKHEVWFYITMRLENITGIGLYLGTIFSMIYVIKVNCVA